MPSEHIPEVTLMVKLFEGVYKRYELPERVCAIPVYKVTSIAFHVVDGASHDSTHPEYMRYQNGSAPLPSILKRVCDVVSSKVVGSACAGVSLWIICFQSTDVHL